MLKKETKKSMKVVLAIFMVVTLLLASACSIVPENAGQTDADKPGTQNESTEIDPGPGKPTNEELELQVLIAEHVSFPVTRYTDSPYLQKITEKTGVKLNLMAVPDAGDAYQQKLNIMLNSNEVPDIIWASKDDALINSLAVKGIFLAYNDYLEHTPVLKNLFEQYPDIEKSYTAQDGKVYIMPRITTNVMSEIFMMREDILSKEGLEEPQTFDEFYTLLKTLKEKYPDKITFINRNGGEHLVNRLAYSWGSGYETGTFGFYLDRGTDQYKYGPTDNNFKFMVEWLKKLYDEEILDAEYALRATNSWEEEMSRGNALFTIDYIDRVKMINSGYIANNMEDRVAAINIPKGPTGQSGILAKSAVMANSGIVVSADVSNATATMKFVDWIYSEEGRLMTSFGIEGESYVVDESGAVMLTPEMQRPANPNGKELVKDFGWVYYMDKYEFPVGYMKDVLPGDPVPEDDRWMYSRKKVEDANQVISADPVLKFTEQQTNELRSKGTNIRDYFKQNIDKFIMGTRPFSEWEQFVDEVIELGVDDVKQIYNDAYDNYKNK